MEYFSQVGSVNYVAIAMADSQDSFDEQCAAYIEFSDKASVIPALKMSGTEYNSRKITLVNIKLLIAMTHDVRKIQRTY